MIKTDPDTRKMLGKDQCSGTVTIFYGSGSGSGSDFWKDTLSIPVPVPTFDKLRTIRFRI